MKIFYVYRNKICNLFISEESGAICRILFKTDHLSGNPVKSDTPLIKETVKQLDEYFSGKRRDFNLPLVLHGTDFQVKVWNALRQIPYGETCTYGEIARMIGSPKACRAVGMANNRNPIPVIIPCHRVIGSNGSLTGYAGGLEIKQKLLNLENLAVL